MRYSSPFDRTRTDIRQIRKTLFMICWISSPNFLHLSFFFWRCPEDMFIDFLRWLVRPCILLRDHPIHKLIDKWSARADIDCQNTGDRRSNKNIDKSSFKVDKEEVIMLRYELLVGKWALRLRASSRPGARAGKRWGMDGYFYNFTSWIVNSVQKNATDICREVNNTAHHGDKVAAIIAPEKSATICWVRSFDGKYDLFLKLQLYLLVNRKCLWVSEIRYLTCNHQ